MAKRKVMIVDDEKDFTKMLKLNLEETKNFEVLALNEGKNIISELEKFRPDIILLDLLMPNVGGIEACEMLNKHPLGAKVPIIILSALNKSVDMLKAYKVGVVDYLTKPVEIQDVILSIEKALKFK